MRPCVAFAADDGSLARISRYYAPGMPHTLFSVSPLNSKSRG